MTRCFLLTWGAGFLTATNEPHLHLQVQDSSTGKEDADRTYLMAFRNVHITSGGAWPLGENHALRTGDLVRSLGL